MSSATTMRHLGVNHIQSLVLAIIVCINSIKYCASEDTYINEFAVHIEGGHDIADSVAKEAGLVNRGQIGSLTDHYLFHAPSRVRRSTSLSKEHHKLLDNHAQVKWFQQQVAKRRVKRDLKTLDLSIRDPLWKDQWYLHGGAYGGHDMNVLDAWHKGFTGKNIVVTILDDGLEHQHEDLKRNYDPYASYDFNQIDSDPTPRYEVTNVNRHGTRCAGTISAEMNNTICNAGIAPDSRIGGVRMLDGDVFDAIEAASLSFNRSHIDIYSASWGPDDNGKVVEGPGVLASKAFIDGINEGRDGKGSIFVWASGNGGRAGDSCSCDGYSSSIFTVSISSTSENAIKPWYLEECSSTLATAYSSGGGGEKQIATTDLRNKCTINHTGTSASAPLAAGIIALMLEANNNLTWRDVQYITLMTARPDPIRDGQWVTNAQGRKVSLRYGYGLMDASAMVDLAQVWTNVPEKHECIVKTSYHNARLVAEQAYSTTIETSACHGESTEIKYLEHVQARVKLTYHRRGRVVIYLTSPSGTRSKLLPKRPSDVKPGGFDNWLFMSVHFWGERPHGIWTLDIENAEIGTGVTGERGTFVSWSLALHGTQTQPVRLTNSTDSSSDTNGDTAKNYVESVKQNYEERIDELVVKQITKRLSASYIYQAYASYFQRADVGLPGIQRFFYAASLEKRGHAQELIEYVNKRGGHALFDNVDLKSTCQAMRLDRRMCICDFLASGEVNEACEERDAWKEGLMAFKDALDIERYVNEQLLDLHRKARKAGDAHLTQVLKRGFLDNQVTSISRIAQLLTRLRSFAGGTGQNYKLAEYLFDQNMAK